MALYLWQEPGKMIEASHFRGSVPEITEPAGVDSDSELVKFHKCTVCNKLFKAPMIVARHFNTNHDDMRKDKDSWRAHSEEIWE